MFQKARIYVLVSPRATYGSSAHNNTGQFWSGMFGGAICRSQHSTMHVWLSFVYRQPAGKPRILTCSSSFAVSTTKIRFQLHSSLERYSQDFRAMFRLPVAAMSNLGASWTYSRLIHARASPVLSKMKVPGGDDAIGKRRKQDLTSKKKNSVLERIPKDAQDNFLVEFNKKKPKYEQLFEYKVNEKEHNVLKFTSISYLSVDVKVFLVKRFEVSFASFKRFLSKYIIKKEVISQMYNVRRHGILSSELATSHFILGRGGKVRFVRMFSMFTELQAE